MTKTASLFRFAILVAVAGFLTVPAYAQDATPPAPADNTEVNMRDRDPSQATADSASNKMSDRQIMQGVRKAVVNDKSLSTYAHNIKIIAANGKVTLKGPVRSEEESQNIQTKATQVAGDGNVINQLSVKAE